MKIMVFYEGLQNGTTSTRSYLLGEFGIKDGWIQLKQQMAPNAFRNLVPEDPIRSD